MTYCLGMLCRKGAVFLSDSRTSAGMDNITVRTKMRVFEKPGDRVICILSSGNLSLTQATMALIDDDLHLNESHPVRSHLLNRPSLYETVRYVGSKVREVEQRDRAALEADGFDFNINLIVGGQIAGLASEVHSIYPQGNSIHASRDCPFLQIGDSKYGKPILDRGLSYDSTLMDALKFGIISMDATMKSNVAVGPPIDILCYKTDSLLVKMRTRLEQNDPYLLEISRKWQDGIVRLVRQMPVADFSKTALGFAPSAAAGLAPDIRS
jgi:putative proteasome-type protease